MVRVRFTKKQLEKMADQARLLSWAQGAILTTGLHLPTTALTITVVIWFWSFFQCIALFIDKWSEK